MVEMVLLQLRNAFLNCHGEAFRQKQIDLLLEMGSEIKGSKLTPATSLTQVMFMAVNCNCYNTERGLELLEFKMANVKF